MANARAGDARKSVPQDPPAAGRTAFAKVPPAYLTWKVPHFGKVCGCAGVDCQGLPTLRARVQELLCAFSNRPSGSVGEGSITKTLALAQGSLRYVRDPTSASISGSGARAEAIECAANTSSATLMNDMAGGRTR